MGGKGNFRQNNDSSCIVLELCFGAPVLKKPKGSRIILAGNNQN